jgi:hypothetical protein
MPPNPPRASRPPRSDDRALRELIAGGLMLPAVLVAHQLELCPLLARGPLTTAEIGAALGIAPRPARALLAACASVGLVSARERRWSLTPLAEDYFLPESPAYFGGYWEMLIATYPLFSFDGVARAIRTDEPQHKSISWPDRPRAFTRAMHDRGMASALVWPARVDLSQHQVVLDVGGGSGVHAIGLCLAKPHLRAIVLDRAEVCTLAAETIAAHGLTDRIRTQPGDIWAEEPFPAADVHLYSEVFHNSSPEQCRALGKKSFAALPPGGRILLHEILYDDDAAGPQPAAASAILMLLWTRGGRQYTAPELFAILGEAGFTGLEVAKAAGVYSIIQARKPA